ncbi:MAG: FAD-dependent oxidoreductase [Saprospiraceae bacterium]
MRICIIGGGLIGLFSAYYLTEKGYGVTIVDKGDFNQGASFGNAGMICPSHFTPLAAPGVVWKSLKWMFNDKSPFYIRPRLNTNSLKWYLQFFRSSNQTNVKNNTGVLNALLTYSYQLYLDLERKGIQMDLQKRGIIMVCNTSHGLQEEIALMHKAAALGIKTDVLNSKEIEMFNPGVEIKSKGGVHYTGDMHLKPDILIDSIKQRLNQRDVTWLPFNEIIDFKVVQNKITAAISKKEEIAAEMYLFAGGSWSNQICQRLNLEYLIEGGKGYNITIHEAAPQLTTPLILTEGSVAVTPMGSALRIGGTMEIAGLDDRIRSSRVTGILNTIEKYLPDYPLSKTQQIEPWFGYRPLSIDGMPVIKKIPTLHNAFINTGHGMLGLSLAPASGKLIEEIISRSKHLA